jgi:TM2 domain-containing membrane protein YozV
MALIHCWECSKQISDRSTNCIHCGAPMRQIIAGSSGKSRSLTIVLALFLGGVGAHKFYLEKPGRGMIYLLWCWTFIPAVVSIVEAFYYLGMPEDEFEAACTGSRKFGWLGE